ncbi:hypothetical protein ACI5KX_14315 [Erythrobacter sp. GH1-10]|uniref:hypothetical protein n=1 Tax=Erythrobacter sp. GH1-10 TaxID=3349334 RepID=UPI003877DF57
MIDRDKLDELYDSVVQMASSLLEKNGEFFPIGATVGVDGTVTHVGFHNGDEHPESQAVIDGLTAIHKQQAASGEILASAIAFDVRVRSPETGDAVDAVMTRIRAADYARDVVLPYTLRTSGLFKKSRSLEVGQPSASEGEQDVFS